MNAAPAAPMAGKPAPADAIAAVGSVADRSSKPGIDKATVEAFFAACAAFDAWKQAHPERLSDQAAVLVAAKRGRP